MVVGQAMGLVVGLPAGKTLPPVPIQLLPYAATEPSAFRPLRVFSFATRGDTVSIAQYDRSSALAANVLEGAYRLDEFTASLIWAVCGFDQSLLDDDGGLWDAWTAVERHIVLPQSVGSHDSAILLSPPSQAWLGSAFCASYIQNTLPAIADVAPSYWTREQHGEEAATWLLFRHKFEYLRRTSMGGTSRVFCIPPDVVVSSSTNERILLLLAFALMESHGVRCEIVDDPTLTNVDGFVLAERKAIRANWIRAQALWNVEVIDQKPIVSDYRDAARHAEAYAINATASPAGRLKLAAEYLMLDYLLIQRRCRELASAGVETLVQPRSRLLSMVGVRTACAFLGSLGDD